MQDYGAFRRQLEAGERSCVQETQAILQAIEARSALNAYVKVYAEEAMATAAMADADAQAGRLKPLTGLLLAVKDNICYLDHSVTASSRILQGYKSLYTATALQRLLDAGAIVIGTTGCDEFAMGSSNETSHYGPVHNPIDESRAPGGSSGGSAAAMGAGLCHAALGSDTGGSIRQPAAFCGIVGVKPTYGRVSRYGLIAFGSSFDQIGPMTRSVRDSALLLEVMAGQDPLDSTSSAEPVQSLTDLPTQPNPLKIAVLRETLHSPGLQPEVKAALLQKIELLRSQGHTVEEIEFPYLDYVVPTYYILATAEASSNLSRYDGIRYGYRSEQAHDLESVYLKSRSEGFGPEVQRRIMLGTFVLSSGYFDAYYTKAQKVRRLLYDYTQQVYSQYDMLLTPTAPTVPFELGSSALKQDPISMYLADIFTVHANLTGHPAVSVPMGTDAKGLPMGLQLMAPYWHEAQMLQLAQTLYA